MGEVMEGLVFGSAEATELFTGVFQRFNPGRLELSHLDEDGGVSSKGHEERFVLFGKQALLLIQELDHAQGPAGALVNRHTEEAPGAIACPRIDVTVKAWIRVSIFKIDDLSCLEAVSCHSRSGRDANDFPFHSQGDGGPQFIRFGVVKKERAAIGVHDLCRLLCDLKKHASIFRSRPMS